MAGVFENGAFSCGFDFPNNPNQIFQFTASGNSFSSGTTRFGVGQSLSAGFGNVGLNLGVNLATLIVGFAVNIPLPGTGWSSIYQWYDSLAGSNNTQVSLQVNSQGQLQFFQGSGTSTPLGAASALGTITTGLWAFLELKITFNSATGAVECRKNGVTSPVITASGLNTAPSGNNQVNRVYFMGNNTAFFDDWYMLDTTGSGALATYLGNGKLQTDAANSDATPNQFGTNPSQGSGSHFNNVKQLPLVNDSSFNFDNTVSDTELYGFPANLGSTPLFLNFWTRQWLDNSGTRTTEIPCKSGSTTVNSAVITPSTNPSYFNSLVQNDPNTSAPWASAAAAQAAAAGVTIAS